MCRVGSGFNSIKVENHLYNLVFDAWDAQFDKDIREWGNFEKASEKELNQFSTCVAHLNELSDFIKYVKIILKVGQEKERE